MSQRINTLKSRGRKLNMQGFAHHVALMAVVVTVGIGGSAYLLLTHADSCTSTSSPTSGATSASSPTSAPTCTSTSSPTSAPVSDPTASKPAYAYTCVLSGVPSFVRSGTPFTPAVTLTNTGTHALNPVVDYYYQNSYGNYSKTIGLTPGQKITIQLAPHTPTSKYNTMDRLNASTYAVNATSPTCNSPAFHIMVAPIKTVSITTADWPQLVKASVITDSPKGKVLLINNGGYAATTSVHGTLTKLVDFAQADAGRKASLCLTGRVNKTGYPISFELGELMSTSSVYYKSFTMKSTYTQQCTTITIPTIDSSLTAQSNPSFDANKNADIDIANTTRGSVEYVSGITITLL